MTKKNDELFDFLPKIDAGSPQGSLGRLKLSDLLPTQNAVGMDEVNAKVAKIKDKKGEQLVDYTSYKHKLHFPHVDSQQCSITL